MANDSLTKAKKAANDEFYTQWNDIEAEVNAYLERDRDLFRGKTVLLPCDDPQQSNFTKYFAKNFEEFGLKRLISTSYAPDAKLVGKWQPDLFDTKQPQYDPAKFRSRGRLFVLDRDRTGDGKIDIDDLRWTYLEGNGDFRSPEVTALRDQADFIVTNPPFSLFREFFEWIVQGEKKFLIIGNVNSITYKEFFPFIKANKAWLGCTIHSGDRKFGVPEEYPLNASTCGVDEQGRKYINVKGVRWFTNIDHNRRHEPLQLMTMADNLKYSKKLQGKAAYDRYDNYDAIEVPEVKCIPSDYKGVMGVPITFLDKYCPEQFEILGATESEGKGFSEGLLKEGASVMQPVIRERERERERETCL